VGVARWLRVWPLCVGDTGHHEGPRRPGGPGAPGPFARQRAPARHADSSIASTIWVIARRADRETEHRELDTEPEGDVGTPFASSSIPQPACGCTLGPPTARTCRADGLPPPLPATPRTFQVMTIQAPSHAQPSTHGEARPRPGIGHGPAVDLAGRANPCPGIGLAVFPLPAREVPPAGRGRPPTPERNPPCKSWNPRIPGVHRLSQRGPGAVRFSLDGAPRAGIACPPSFIRCGGRGGRSPRGHARRLSRRSRGFECQTPLTARKRRLHRRYVAACICASGPVAVSCFDPVRREALIATLAQAREHGQVGGDAAIAARGRRAGAHADRGAPGLPRGVHHDRSGGPARQQVYEHDRCERSQSARVSRLELSSELSPDLPACTLQGVLPRLHVLPCGVRPLMECGGCPLWGASARTHPESRASHRAQGAGASRRVGPRCGV